MENEHDVFRQSESGDKVLVETVIGLDKTKALLEVLSSFKPGKYLIYDALQEKFIEPFKASARHGR